MVSKDELLINDIVRDKNSGKIYEITSLAPTKPRFVRARRIQPPRTNGSITPYDTGNYIEIARLEHAIAPDIIEMIEDGVHP